MNDLVEDLPCVDGIRENGAIEAGRKETACTYRVSKGVDLSRRALMCWV